MKPVEIIAAGNELLAGDILDTNFRALAQRLVEIGVEVGRHVTVGDDDAAIAAQVADSLGRSDVVILTGGLGPTADDRTRFGVARALGKPLVRDPAVVEAIRARFRLFGVREMPLANEVQAMFPEGALVLANPNGTAAGFRSDVPPGPGEPRHVFALPGPPHELGPMIDLHLIPFLEQLPGLPAIRSLRLRTLGIGESALAGRIRDWPFGVGGVELGYYPQDPGVDLKITSRAGDPASAASQLEAASGHLRRLLGPHIYAEGAATLARVLGDLLRERGLTLSVAESCTGGLAASIVTSAPGSSDYFDSGVVSYSYTSKEDWLQVQRPLIERRGAVSAEVARVMAESVRRRRGTDYGLGITGVAGPAGGTPEKPVGLVYIAVSGPEGTEVRETRHAGDRASVRRRAAMTALDLLRRRLLGAEEKS